MTSLRLFVLLASFVTVLSAQVPTHLALGDIAAVGNTAEIRVMDENGVITNGFSTVSALFTLLWDPADPDSFIGGAGSTSSVGGFLNRITFTGGGQTLTTQLVPPGQMGTPAQIGWDQTGQNVIVASSTSDQVYSVDANTGAVTPLTAGAQAWGSQLSAGAMDPLTGDLYIGSNTGEIWRIASGTSGATLFQSGFGAVQKILIDDQASPHYLYFATASSFHRVDLMNPGVVENYFGTFGTPSFNNLRGFSFDTNGDFVIVTSQDDIWELQNAATIPATGIAPTLLGALAFPTTAGTGNDVAVVGATTRPFRLTLRSLPILGAEIRLDDVPAGVQRGYLFLSASTFLPRDSGPFFGLLPDLLTLDIMAATPAPGGLLAFTNVPPAPLTLPQFTMAPFFNQTWDGVAVAFGATGQFLGRSNVVRVTWQ